MMSICGCSPQLPGTQRGQEFLPTFIHLFINISGAIYNHLLVTSKQYTLIGCFDGCHSMSWHIMSYRPDNNLFFLFFFVGCQFLALVGLHISYLKNQMKSLSFGKNVLLHAQSTVRLHLR